PTRNDAPPIERDALPTRNDAPPIERDAFAKEQQNPSTRQPQQTMKEDEPPGNPERQGISDPGVPSLLAVFSLTPCESRASLRSGRRALGDRPSRREATDDSTVAARTDSNEGWGPENPVAVLRPARRARAHARTPSLRCAPRFSRGAPW